MDSLDRLIDRRAPVAPDASLSELAERFAAEPEASVLAVVEDDNPLGLIHRQAVETAVRLPGTTALARELMDRDALLVASHTPSRELLDDLLADRPQGLAKGFIVTEDGRYLGVGSGSTLLAARRSRSRGERDAGVALTQTLTDEVLRQLDGARTFLDGLRRQPLPADAAACAQALDACFGDLRRLMSRAGALHGASRGLIQPTPRPTLLRDVIDQLEDRWAVRAAEAGVTLLTAYDGAPDLAAEIDAGALAELFDVLVERALSETSRGAVEATLRVQPAVDGLTLEGRVRDAGPTPDPARLARIFDPLDSGAPLSIGLGMAYAATMVGAMNGVIRAEANPGAGATVIFDMIAPEVATVAETPINAMVSTTAHILIVDDNATNRMVAEALCEMFDCTSEQAVDGIEAVEAASARRFDLILMDIKMPRMDGVAATRAIRALPGAAGEVPIVALTANADPSDVRGYLEAGMNEVVEKPIKADRLLTVLDQVLNGTAPQAEHRGSAAA